MGIQWKRLWIRVIVWALAEIVLSTIGLDTLADYSEFLLGTPMPQLSRNHSVNNETMSIRFEAQPSGV